MARRHGKPRVAIKSCQGFILRRVSQADANALAAAEELGYVKLEDGSLMKTSYQSAREDSPSVITAADMRLNVGECGEPRPMEDRREGYIDAVEAARDKIRAWPSIVQQEVQNLFVEMCPWPQNRAYQAP